MATQLIRLPAIQKDGVWTVNFPTFVMVALDTVKAEAIIEVFAADLPESMRTLKGGDKTVIDGKDVRTAVAPADKDDWDALLAARYPGKPAYTTGVK